MATKGRPTPKVQFTAYLPNLTQYLSLSVINQCLLLLLFFKETSAVN